MKEKIIVKKKYEGKIGFCVGFSIGGDSMILVGGRIIFNTTFKGNDI